MYDEENNMSRSRLRNKFMRTRWFGRPNWYAKRDKEIHNPHRQDEAPKNHPSKLITMHCSADVPWLEDSTSFGGHSRPKGGHRRVSGLVRASLRREMRKLILEQLQKEEG